MKCNMITYGFSHQPFGKNTNPYVMQRTEKRLTFYLSKDLTSTNGPNKRSV